MEGKFVGGTMAGVAMIGQPNVAAHRLDNPIEMPGALSFLAYGHFGSFVHGLEDYPQDTWPDNIELLYYSFHIMITLGTLFILLMGWATLQNWRNKLESSPLLLWVLMLAFPYPYIANTLGWELIDAETAHPTDRPDAQDYLLRGRAVIGNGNVRESIETRTFAFWD